VRSEPLAAAGLLVLGRFEVRLHSVGACRQCIIHRPANCERLDLVQLLDEIVKRRRPQRAFALLGFERLLAVAKLEVYCPARVDPELLARDTLALTE
jgi:hypothetical protein